MYIVRYNCSTTRDIHICLTIKTQTWSTVENINGFYWFHYKYCHNVHTCTWQWDVYKTLMYVSPLKFVCYY